MKPSVMLEKVQSDSILGNESSRTYNKFNGKRSIKGRTKKKRRGAWMRAVSNGLDETGGWYTRRATLE